VRLNAANSELSTVCVVSSKLHVSMPCDCTYPSSCMSVCLVTALTHQVLNVNCGTYFVFKIAGLFFSLLLLK